MSNCIGNIALARVVYVCFYFLLIIDSLNTRKLLILMRACLPGGPISKTSTVPPYSVTTVSLLRAYNYDSLQDYVMFNIIDVTKEDTRFF